MRIRMLLILLVVANQAFAQHPQPESDVHFVEASFPGGALEMKRFIQRNLRYPETAFRNREEGRVYVQFVVEKDGKLSNISVLRGGLTDALNAEAIRIIESMPNWIPSETNGTKVQTYCRLPITFELDNWSRKDIRRELKSNEHE